MYLLRNNFDLTYAHILFSSFCTMQINMYILKDILMQTKKLNASKKNKFPPPFLIQRPGVIIGIARTEGNANYRCNIRKKMYLISTTTFSQSQMSQTSRHHQNHSPHTLDRFLPNDRFLPKNPRNLCLHTLHCTSAFLSLNCCSILWG